MGVTDTCVGVETLGDGEPGRAGDLAGGPDRSLQNPGTLMIEKKRRTFNETGYFSYGLFEPFSLLVHR